MPSFSRSPASPAPTYVTTVETASKKDGVVFPYRMVTTLGPQYVVPRLTEFKDWTRTPGFRALKKSGVRLPENPFTLTKTTCSLNSIVVRATRSYSAPNINGDYSMNVTTHKLALRLHYSPPTSLPASLSISDSEMAIRFLNHIKDAEWQAPVFVAEGKKAIDMILGVAKSLSLVIRNLRRGNLVGALAELGLKPNPRARRRFNRLFGDDPSKAAANAWLQYKYGWIPLLLDAKSAAETFAELVAKDRNLPRISSVSMVKKSDFLSTALFSGQPSGSGKIAIYYQGVVSRRYKVAYKVNPLDALGSFGLLNPVSVFWELVPLSFVADWFVPIGNYLQHLDANLRYTFLSGLSSTKVSIDGIAYMTAGDGVNFSVGDADTFSSLSVVAVKMSVLPTPSVKDIRFDPKLGLHRLISGVALLRQNAKRLG